MANQVTFIVQGLEDNDALLADAFTIDGVPIQPQSAWAQFQLNGKVWNPGQYGDPAVPVIIGKGTLTSDPDNNFVAYAIAVEFNSSVEDGSVIVGVGSQPACKDGNNPCYVFEIIETINVQARLLTNGEPVSGTQLPKRCDC